MPGTLRLQFDPNQPHQLTAVESVARLFDGLPLRSASFMQEEIIPNMPPFESPNDDWLYDNLRQVQQDNGLPVELGEAWL